MYNDQGGLMKVMPCLRELCNQWLPMFNNTSKKAAKTVAFGTDYVNAMDSPIVFQCGSGVIHGIESYHQDTYEDRRFKFKCCNLPRK